MTEGAVINVLIISPFSSPLLLVSKVDVELFFLLELQF